MPARAKRHPASVDAIRILIAGIRIAILSAAFVIARAKKGWSDPADHRAATTRATARARTAGRCANRATGTFAKAARAVVLRSRRTSAARGDNYGRERGRPAPRDTQHAWKCAPRKRSLASPAAGGSPRAAAPSEVATKDGARLVRPCHGHHRERPRARRAAVLGRRGEVQHRSSDQRSAARAEPHVHPRR